jgi:hypothetical protein
MWIYYLISASGQKVVPVCTLQKLTQAFLCSSGFLHGNGVRQKKEIFNLTHHAQV